MQAPGNEWKSRIGNAAFCRRWRNGGGRDVVDRMALERDVFITRWAQEKAELVLMYACELVDTVQWAQRQHLGARIFPNCRKEGRRNTFMIEINIGTQFVIDDLVCGAFAQRSFLKDYEIDVDAIANPLIFQFPCQTAP